MKCVRFEVNNRAKIGIIEGETVRTVYGSLDTFWQLTDEVFPLSRETASALRTKADNLCWLELQGACQRI